MTRVAVVGGGIAGLTVAYGLAKRGVGPVTVLESRPRLGGTIVTVRERGFVVEGGPDSFITQKPWARELCEELGLGDRLIPTATRRLYVLSGGRLHALPEGVFLTVPTRVWPFLTSSLFSWRGKLRMGLDLVLPRGKAMEDESLGSFVRRRLGREALEKLAEPLMGGIFLADADELSLRSTFPRFLDLEQKHRSLIRALRKAPVGGATPPFLSLRGGMTELVERLVERMAGVDLRTGGVVRAIEPGWKVRLADGELVAEHLVLAIPPPRAAELLRSVSAPLADAIASIKVVSSATVSLGFRRADVRRPLDATGFVIPRGEGRRIAACTWSSSKFDGRAPANHVLVRCFFKEPPDNEAGLIAIAGEEIRALLGISAEPVLANAFRWPEANPIYQVGHEARVQAIEALVPPDLHLVGSGYRGVGIPDCVREAQTCANRISRRVPG
jgi:oxygen-dependent protoporphyrinogen oxidase